MIPEEKKRTALVTGSTTGIGRAIAKSLAEENIDIVVSGRRGESEVDSFLDELHTVTKGGNHCYVRGDIADETVRRKIKETIAGRFGSLDILVNNAGIAPSVRKDMLDLTEDDLCSLLKVNLHAPFLLTSLLAPLMGRSQGRSYIINISSISAYTASVYRAEYCLSKAAVSMMTTLFARRLVGDNIRVFEIRPGIIKTDMTVPVKDKYDRLIEEGLLPIPRWGQPEDIGRTVLGIIKGYHPYSTGEVINVDGGFHIRSL